MDWNGMRCCCGALRGRRICLGAIAPGGQGRLALVARSQFQRGGRSWDKRWRSSGVTLATWPGRPRFPAGVIRRQSSLAIVCSCRRLMKRTVRNRCSVTTGSQARGCGPGNSIAATCRRRSTARTPTRPVRSPVIAAVCLCSLATTRPCKRRPWISTGTMVWSTLAAPFVEKKYPNGYAASPVVYGDTVIVAVDCEGGGTLVALDRNTGKRVWATSRVGKTNYASPVVGHVAGKDQLLLGGLDMVASLQPGQR